MELALCITLGLAIGHVMDLAFVHFYTEETFSGPLFRCAACRAPFRAQFAVPLAGWAATGGRCPDCGMRLPLRGAFLPLGGAALYAASYFAFDKDLAGGLLGGGFLTIFLTLTFTDFDRRLLPNRIVYPSTVLAIALCWAWPDSGAVEVLAGGLAGISIGVILFLFSLPFGAGAFGMGDVKMIILIGFVVGMPEVLVAVFVGTLAAAVVSMLLIITRIKGRKDYIPHGPFLALGAMVALFWGPEIWDAYTG
jgi:prepilin signal peptidase PulO-like enzyme (type II secretory pathway)